MTALIGWSGTSGFKDEWVYDGAAERQEFISFQPWSFIYLLMYLLIYLFTYFFTVLTNPLL